VFDHALLQTNINNLRSFIEGGPYSEFITV